MEGSIRRFGAGIYQHGRYEFGHWRVITRIIIDTDEEHSALVSGLIGLIRLIRLIEHQLNRVYGEVEAVRGWR